MYLFTFYQEKYESTWKTFWQLSHWIFPNFTNMIKIINKFYQILKIATWSARISGPVRPIWKLYLCIFVKREVTDNFVFLTLALGWTPGEIHFCGTPGPPGTPGCVSIPTKPGASYNFISANFRVGARGEARGPLPTLGSTLTPDAPKLHQRTHSPTRLSPPPSLAQIPPAVRAWLKDRVGDTHTPTHPHTFLFY